MPNPENFHRPPAPATRGVGKPSLTDDLEPPGAAAGAPTRPMRMLDGLDGSTAGAQTRSMRGAWKWALPSALLVGAMLCAWWWNHARDPSLAPDADRSGLRTTGKVPGLAAAVPPQPGSSAAPVPTTAPPTSVARIEAAPDAAAAPNQRIASAAAAVVASIAASSNAAASGAASAAAPTLRTAAHVRAPMRAGSQMASVDTRPHPRPKQVVSNSAPTGSASKDATLGGDPDVSLLSALLAHLSREGRSIETSPQAQLTIAQLVGRCETRAAKDAIETFECKRRICEGYWGKAEACPMSLAPKRN